ncbi:MAG: flagellar basal body-associated protein FliL [Gammaproteobacteria bacterium]
MAEEDDKDGSEEGAEESKGGSKKKLIIMIVAAVLIIGGGAGGAMFFMGGEEEVAEGEEGAAEEAEEEPKDIAYVPFAKPLVVNFQAADGKTRFLKTEVTLMTEDEARIADIEKHLPKIQHIVNLVFSRQVYEELGTPEGKEKMRLEALQEIKNILKKSMGEKSVDDILYTNFVTQ